MSKKLVPLGFVTALFVLACQPTAAIAGEPDANANVKGEKKIVKTDSKTPAPSSSVDPAKLRLEVGRAGLEDTNFVHILGEVHNDTGQPLEWVTIHIELLDKNGSVLDVGGWHREIVNAEHARGELHYVPIGGSTPFHYIRDASKIKGTYGGHRLTVTAKPRSAPMPSAIIEGLTTTPGDLGQVDLKGTLKVTGNVDCRSPNALVGFYDDSGKLIDLVTPHHSALEGFFQKKLAVGQSIAFEGKSFPFGGGVGRQGGAKSKTKVWAICDNWISE